ncbi:hypothetical protein [Halorhodospira halophila]|uniref:Mn2+-dependent serine/threonine protein kinase n=1 Tax=Halorhodospira halophila (strain DSM 244 / SL1) TaxID=349124 RepID=A1WV61_HALHL|nr:hypothetical protein [Halorhodospira halophila]ABM61573.1 hypothetical protein Hhal_0797 [Halorhodospira halophila SL1]
MAFPWLSGPDTLTTYVPSGSPLPKHTPSTIILPGYERTVRDIASALEANVHPIRDHSTLELIKSSKALVYRWSCAEKPPLIIKFYYAHTIKDRLKALLRPPKSLLQTALALRAKGIRVPRPVAAIQVHLDSRRYGAYIMECAPGATLREWGRKGLPDTYHMHLAEEMGFLWGLLLRHNYLHMDPIRGNFLYDTGGALTALDIDNIYKLPWLPDTVRARRLLKMAHWHLLRSPQLLGDTPERELIKRFVHAYARGRGVTAVEAWREWRHVVDRLARRNPHAYYVLQRVPLRP